MMRALENILVEDFHILPESLEEVRRIQEEKKKDFWEAVLQANLLDESQLIEALGKQWSIPVIDKITDDQLDVTITEKFPIQYLRLHKIVPIKYSDDRTVVVISSPRSISAVDDIRIILEMENIDIFLAPENEVLSAINRTYDQATHTAESVIADMDSDESSEILSQLEETADLLDDTSDAPIIRLVNLILSQAVKSRASDIHIEPFQRHLKVRFRIDGILYNTLSPPRHIHSAIVSRIKIMARLNIAEKRLPQDGRIEIKIGDRPIDIRVSTLPTIFGERVVLRLLDKSESLLRLEELGLSDKQLDTFLKLISQPNGIILVTGPTGSGKTTTLYAALSRINSPDKNIITIEDPIEYQLDGIGQIQVNPKINLTFATGLRSIVRQDPDVILVGEIRDLETAEIAIQSALTGHLVFSTLHTNDSAGAITRLIDMGIEPFLVSSAVNAILAQRLVRVICPFCKEEYNPPVFSLKEIGLDDEAISGTKFYRGKGCPECSHTGFRGRMGIYELLILDDEIKSLISRTSDSNDIKREALRKGLVTLRQDGAQKVLEGFTTVEEVIRVTQA
ncbi:MAG: type II secretion system protein GspE [Deltaproteobacteria bacterium]|nr:MAG: type II secretion system protein GspE [Deltaproteobacteria bacterium]RLB09264.1 MAG: type II secretion system protein GspE [Deltaproteobacteria bacterium]